MYVVEDWIHSAGELMAPSHPWPVARGPQSPTHSLYDSFPFRFLAAAPSFLLPLCAFIRWKEERRWACRCLDRQATVHGGR